jgi:uncharacterized protein YcbX
MSPAQVRVDALHVYPVKSCAGIARVQVALESSGLAGDRRWLVVSEAGRFRTQREFPRLALIRTSLDERVLRLSAAGTQELRVPLERDAPAARVAVRIWNDQCEAEDEGSEAARWLSDFLGVYSRLVRFAPGAIRHSDAHFSGRPDAPVRFADGYALLVVSDASRAAVERAVRAPAPMNRFRPNIVLSGLPEFAEDDIAELHAPGISLRFVKPCLRCAITVTDQERGERDDPPAILDWLREHRWSTELSGACFGYNAIIERGAGLTLAVGMTWDVIWRRPP